MLTVDIVERRIQELKIELNSDFARQLKRHATIILFWGEKKSDLETGHIALIIPYEESYVYISFWPKSEAEQSKLKNTAALFLTPVNGVFHSYEDDYKNENHMHFTEAYVLFGLNVDSMHKHLFNLCTISQCDEQIIKKDKENILKYNYMVRSSKISISWFLWSAFTKQESYSNCVQFTRKLLLIGGMVGYIDDYSSLLVYDRLATQIGGLYRNCLPTLMSNSTHFKCVGRAYNNKLINILSKIYFVLFNYENQVSNKEWLYGVAIIYIFLIFDFIRVCSFKTPEHLSLAHEFLYGFDSKNLEEYIFLAGYFLPIILSLSAGWLSGYALKEDSYFREYLKYITFALQIFNVCNLLRFCNGSIQLFNMIRANNEYYRSLDLNDESWSAKLKIAASYADFIGISIYLIWHVFANSLILGASTIGLYKSKISGLKNDNDFLYTQKPGQLSSNIKNKMNMEYRFFSNRNYLGNHSNEVLQKTAFEKLCEFSILIPAMMFYVYQVYRLMMPQNTTASRRYTLKI